MPNATIQTKGERPRAYRPLFREGSLGSFIMATIQKPIGSHTTYTQKTRLSTLRP